MKFDIINKKVKSVEIIYCYDLLRKKGEKKVTVVWVEPEKIPLMENW